MEDFTDLNDVIQFTALVLVACMRNELQFIQKVSNSTSILISFIQKPNKCTQQLFIIIINASIVFDFDRCSLFNTLQSSYRRLLYQDTHNNELSNQHNNLLLEIICQKYEKSIFTLSLKEIEKKPLPNSYIQKDELNINLNLLSEKNSFWQDRQLVSILYVHSMLLKFSQNCLDNIISYCKDVQADIFYILFLCCIANLNIDFLSISYCQKIMVSDEQQTVYKIYNIVRNSQFDINFLNPFFLQQIANSNNKEIKLLTIELIILRYKYVDNDFLQDILKICISDHNIQLSYKALEFMSAEDQIDNYKKVIIKCLSSQSNEIKIKGLQSLSSCFIDLFEDITLIALKSDETFFIHYLEQLNNNFMLLYGQFEDFEYDKLKNIFNELQQRHILFCQKEQILSIEVQKYILTQNVLDFLIQFDNSLFTCIILNSINYELNQNCVRIILEQLFNCNVYLDFYGIQLLNQQQVDVLQVFTDKQQQQLFAKLTKKINNEYIYFENKWLIKYLDSINEAEPDFYIFTQLIVLTQQVNNQQNILSRRSSGLSLDDLNQQSTVVSNSFQILLQKFEGEKKLFQKNQLTRELSQQFQFLQQDYVLKFISIFSNNFLILNQDDLIEKQLIIFDELNNIEAVKYAYNIIHNFITLSNSVQDKDLVIKTVQAKLFNFLNQIKLNLSDYTLIRKLVQISFNLSNLSLTKQYDTKLLLPLQYFSLSMLQIQIVNQELRFCQLKQQKNLGIALASQIQNILMRQFSSQKQLPKLLSVSIPFIALAKLKIITVDLDILDNNFIFYEIKDFIQLLQQFCESYYTQYNIASVNKETSYKAQQYLPVYSIYYLIQSLSHVFYSKLIEAQQTLSFQQLSHLCQQSQFQSIIQQIFKIFVDITVLNQNSTFSINFLVGAIAKFENKRMCLFPNYSEDVRVVQQSLIYLFKQQLDTLEYEQELVQVSYPSGIFE
eukprot:EST46608.1 Hypothetical protein SS50377_13413 [Spironucleus salmonicida]